MNLHRRNSASGRLNLSTNNISSPIAESTHLNGSSGNSKFPWGRKLFSPPKSLRPSSPPVLPKTTMSAINKIDQRVYIDVQSRGLASRIVRYHENGSKLNRSLSMGNIYNKPGQFPIVHLKKKQIVYKPRRNQNNTSMVRIPPPDKSVFQANTRSSILRTGSIVPTVGLPRSDDEVSRENRPILHPVGSELTPTKSVLDALREISRKRIHNDELDRSDSIKKYCKESDDTDRGVHLRPTYNATTKRQREGPSSPTSNASVSPEQMSKKRMFSKNNDILSSLSSSLRMATSKRKFDDMRASKSSEKCTDSSTSPEVKQQCSETNFVSFPKMDAVLASQLTPLTPTPAVESVNLRDIPKSCPEAVKEKSKPKLNLFNKIYDKAPTTIAYKSNLDDFALGGVIPFVKPKNNTQISETNPIIERTKKSKLALMLSGLRGDLNEDVANNRATEKKIEENVSSSQINLPVVPTVSSASISFETKTTIATIPTVSSNTTTELNKNKFAGTSILMPVTIGNQNLSGGSAPSSIPLSLPNLVKTTASGMSFLSQVSSPQTTATTSTSKPGQPAVKPTSEVTDSSVNLKSTTTPALMQQQFSSGTKSAVSTAGSVPAFSMASSQNATKISFGVPNSIAPADANTFKISTTSTLTPKSTNNEMKPVGLSLNNQSAFSANAGTEGSKTSQPLNFSATQSAAATTNITSSLFSTPSTSLSSNTKTLLGVSNLGTVKTDSQNVENKSSHGFTFAPLNSVGDPKANTTSFTFSSNSSNQKAAEAGSPEFSFSPSKTSAPVFGVPTTSTQITSAPAFGVTSTANSSSSTGSAGIQFSFSANNANPSTGFTLAGAATDFKQQPATISAAPSPFGAPKPQSAPTSNALLSNPTDQEKSNLFSFGAPNPQQKPVAGSSIFAGTNDGNSFSFTGGDQKVPASTSTNIFETVSYSFAAPTTTMNFAFTPQTTVSSIFGAATTTNSNSFRMPQTTASSVFGTPTASAAPAFGVTTAPAPSSIFGQASNTSSAFGAPKTTASSVFAPSMPESKPSAPLAFGVPASSSNTPANTKSFSFGANNNSTSTGAFSFSAALGNAPNKEGISPTPTATHSNSFSFRQGQSVNNNNPVFGTPARNSTNASSVFGGTAVNQTKTFNFSAESNAAAPSNSFGSVPAENKTDNIFSFGVAAQQPANTDSNSKPFTFGGSGGSSAFAFNATSAAPAPVNKTFNFGASPTQSGNQSSNTSRAQFNFNSGTNGPPAATTTQANLFSPGQASTPSTMNNPTRVRVIRIATRRLNK